MGYLVSVTEENEAGELSKGTGRAEHSKQNRGSGASEEAT
jgi:hypothetical protein